MKAGFATGVESIEGALKKNFFGGGEGGLNQYVRGKNGGGVSKKGKKLVNT